MKQPRKGNGSKLAACTEPQEPVALLPICCCVRSFTVISAWFTPNSRTKSVHTGKQLKLCASVSNFHSKTKHGNKPFCAAETTLYRRISPYIRHAEAAEALKYYRPDALHSYKKALLLMEDRPHSLREHCEQRKRFCESYKENQNQFIGESTGRPMLAVNRRFDTVSGLWGVLLRSVR